MSEDRIVVNPFLQGKLRDYGQLMEPDDDGIFQNWLARHPEFHGAARESEPFDPGLFDLDSVEAESESYDDAEIEEIRREDIRDCARDLLLVERAREWLLE